jgi:hypothetical protein
MGFSMILVAIVLVGVGAIAASKNEREDIDETGPGIGDHWHAVLGINICGEWVPDVAPYESAKGIHSHGDGFIHMHPTGTAGAHKNATVGLFLEQADYKVTDSSVKIPGQDIKENGDKCKDLDNQAAGLRWSVNGKDKPLRTDPADYVPENGDVIAIAFLPQKTPIGTPPTAEKGETPTDVAPTNTPSTVVTEDSNTTTTAGEGGDTTTTTAAQDESDTTTTTGGD